MILGQPQVGRQLGVGEGDMPEFPLLQHLTFVIHIASLCRPEREPAGCVSEARSRGGSAFLRQPGSGFVVGSKQHIEGRAAFDLGVKLARCAEGKRSLVAGILFECSGNQLCRCGEIGSNGDGDFFCTGQCRSNQQRK